MGQRFAAGDSVWLVIGDEAIGARFVEYKTDPDGYEWCVCTYSDLILKGKVHAGPEITFAKYADCKAEADKRK